MTLRHYCTDFTVDATQLSITVQICNIWFGALGSNVFAFSKAMANPGPQAACHARMGNKLSRGLITCWYNLSLVLTIEVNTLRILEMRVWKRKKLFYSVRLKITLVNKDDEQVVLLLLNTREDILNSQKWSNSFQAS